MSNSDEEVETAPTNVSVQAELENKTDVEDKEAVGTLPDITGDDVEDDETERSEVCVESLHSGDKVDVGDKMALTAAGGEMLTYNQIQAAQRMLRCQYPALQGLDDPVHGFYDVGFAKMTGKGLQINHDGNKHWVLSAYTGGQVCLYDGLGVSMMTKPLLIQLCQSYAAFSDKETDVLPVVLPEVQSYWDENDCGLFAIAWAVDIAEGQDMSTVVYDDRKMRSHLEMCFKEEKLTPFPRLTSRRLKVGPTKAHQISLVCRCEQGGRLGRMERCKACRRMFHVSCLPVSPPRDGTWACGDCGM